jgi:hypothetical protein
LAARRPIFSRSNHRFALNTVDANYSDDGKDTFRRFQSHQIPKKLYELLRVTFSEVERAAAPDPQSAD